MSNVIIVDTSGSMGEVGKGAVVRNVLYALENILKMEHSEFDYGIYSWHDTVEEWGKKVSYSGKTDPQPLKTLFDKNGVGNVLLVTDGNFSEDAIKYLKTVSIMCTVLLVGRDCNTARIKRIFQADKIYNTTDVVTCIENYVNEG